MGRSVTQGSPKQSSLFAAPPPAAGGSPQLDLAALLRQESLVAHFQPLVATRTRSVMGVEALCRGVDPSTGRLVPPLELFAAATSDELLIGLDRLCRRKALQSFRDQLPKCPDLLLSINFEASLLDRGVAGSGHLSNLVREMGLEPHRIIIEIVESKVSNLKALERFVAQHREHGFLLALDDVGSGHSNLERIATLKPDILKLGRTLIDSLDEHYHQQEVTRSLLKLAHKIGALVVAEGVERQEELLITLEMGVDLVQGYLFARPSPSLEPDERCLRQIQVQADSFKQHLVRKIAAIKDLHAVYEQVALGIARRLQDVEPAAYDGLLRELIGSHPAVECLYILDQDGVQVSETVCDLAKLDCQRKAIFWPAVKGSDQSLRRYYILLTAGLERFVSEPYISLASGNPCVTISRWFTHGQGGRHILCADFEAGPLLKAGQAPFFPVAADTPKPSA